MKKTIVKGIVLFLVGVALLSVHPVEARRVKEGNRFMPLDYKTILSSNVRFFFFGEAHDDVASKQNLKSKLSLMKSLGFTHLAMEMLPTWYQETVDEYLEYGTGLDKLDEYLKYDWDFSPGSAEAYLELIKEAKRVGLKVLAIGISQGMASRMTLENIDKLMTENLINKVTDEDRVIILTGGFHARKVAMPQVLQNVYKLDSVSIEYEYPDNSTYSITSWIESKGIKIDFDDRPYMFSPAAFSSDPIYESHEFFKFFDWYICLP